MSTHRAEVVWILFLVGVVVVAGVVGAANGASPLVLLGGGIGLAGSAYYVVRLLRSSRDSGGNHG